MDSSVGLVGLTVGAATPVFPVIGLYRFACHVFPDRFARVAVLGSGAAIVSFGFRDLLPQLIEHGELIAPFALTNGIFASSSYAILEFAVGRARLMRWPSLMIGAGLGGFTGGIAPYAYSTALHFAFGLDLELRRYVDWMLPVSIPTGLAAGAVLGPLLRPIIAGIDGIPWTRVAGPVKLAAVAFVAWVYGRALWICNRPLRLDDYIRQEEQYYQQQDTQKVYLYIDPELREKALSVLRLHPLTGERASSDPSFRTALPLSDNGTAADLAQRLSNIVLEKEQVYPNIRAARLAYALDRFPLLLSILQVDNLTETTRLHPDETYQNKALTTDAIARLGILMTLFHRTQDDCLAQIVAEFQKHTNASLNKNHLGELGQQALAVIALLQQSDHDIIDARDRQLKQHLSTSLLMSSPNSDIDQEFKNLVSDLHFSQLNNSLKEAKINIPFHFWLDYKNKLSLSVNSSRRRRAAVLCSILLTASGFFFALGGSSSS
eukprot:CAMPEP_0197307628 /NCGR_PEP_ID=MMETSP0891-20130614/5481_1 /TAXON_ID=44058 ORGANISM="Aureoumbra lagunensis, Strain CCMP1510" /NCGR_SAMPLE_ID=MMETSP0891 /ASSEMBLY_ACC=CAM_ASM_000534 /LENGTH=490 /DNA_ID=CAMNT_0042791195 /DNA_START=145 /DNA_END=1618 /DNA_ORIENTATION=-